MNKIFNRNQNHRNLPELKINDSSFYSLIKIKKKEEANKKDNWQKIK
jgi:hypothetical protein